MNRNRIFIMLLIVLLLSSTIVNGQSTYIDKSKINKGVIQVNYKDRNKIGAVRITKGNINYDYFLTGNNYFPLQSGNGEYTISVLENIDGKRFKQISKETVNVKLENVNEVYLQSIQMINWNNKMNATKKAKELTKSAKNDREKIISIYEYIVNSISYDKLKASKIKSNYIPNVDETIRLQKGICYDYSSLFAAMLRSVDIHTKLVMGYKNDIREYHAWNQVYLEEENIWITIDTTYDAGLKNSKIVNNMIKSEKDYKIEKVY